MSQAQRHYETLGVRQSASAHTIDNAYQEFINQLHPWTETDADERRVRQQILDRVNVAYTALRRSRGGRRRAH